jgi:hypothetical protein
MRFKKIEEHTGGGNYIKLKDKESIVGIFAGDPYEYTKAWQDERPRFRFKINFIVKDGPTFVPKVFDGSFTVYKQLEELHAEYDLTSTYVKITRNGEGLDTTFSILPGKKQPTAEELAHIKTLTLHDLKEKKQDAYAGTPLADDGLEF